MAEVVSKLIKTDLKEFLGNLKSSYGIDLGICVSNKEQVLFSYNENAVFPAASLVKVPLVLLILKKCQEKILNLSTYFKIDKKVGGAGIIKDLTIKKYKLIDLITLALILSDNTASNTLINLTTFNEINDFFKAIGLVNTCLKRKFMVDLINPPVNFTTAYEMNQIFQKVLNIEILNFRKTVLFFKILSKQQYTEKIPRELRNEDIIICNKTGDIEGISHDSAVLFLDNSIEKAIKENKFIILTILTSFSKEVERDFVNKIIGDISKKIYLQFLKGGMKNVHTNMG